MSALEPSDAAYHHRLVVGYHGCEREFGEAVLLGKAQLEPSANDYDWLGGGIYFWEHGFRRALEWAQENRKDPFVLGAYIHLGRCLDLTDTWATACIRMKTHIQVAVRDPKRVLGFFVPADMLSAEAA